MTRTEGGPIAIVPLADYESVLEQLDAAHGEIRVLRWLFETVPAFDDPDTNRILREWAADALHVADVAATLAGRPR